MRYLGYNIYLFFEFGVKVSQEKKMIRILTKTVKEEPPEMTINLGEAKFIKFLPTCPKCKLMDNVFFFHVTQEIYECTGCNLRFRFAK